jgi:nitronate monooxygenase
MTSDKASRLPVALASRLRVPVIVAPMLRVSGPDLIIAACRAGVMAAFPSMNARTPALLDTWLEQMATAAAAAAGPVAPHCVNLVMRPDIIAEYLPGVVEHRVEVVITSVGSPAPVLDRLHDVGTFVLSDVATLEHARKAVRAGADGLVLLTAGSGGQTGWLNPFAFVRAVRDFFDGPVVLAGGLSDGIALRAALELGADLGYIGTRFIAARESMASGHYRRQLVDCSLDDVLLTRAFTGLPANFLRPTVAAAGLDPAQLDEQVTPDIANAVYGGRGDGTGPKRWTDVVSAGHSVSGVRAVQSVEQIVTELERGFNSAAMPGAVAL